MTNATILIVSENPAAAPGLKDCLTGLGYKVCATVPFRRQAIEPAASLGPDLALIDVELAEDADGLEETARLWSRLDIPVVCLVEEAGEPLWEQVRAFDPLGYVLKPFEEGQLHLNIQAALARRRRECEHRETESRMEQTIAELRQQSQLMQTVFDNMEEGVAVADATGRLLLFNPSAERIIGKGLEDSAPDEWSETYGAFYPDRETRVPTDQLPLVRALRGENTDAMEVYVRNDAKTDGVHVSATGRFIPGMDNRVTAGVVVFTDITRHKQQEEQLKQTIQRLNKQAKLMETVFRSVSDGVVVTGKDGSFLFVNPVAEQIVGMGATDTSSDEWSETYGTFCLDGKTLFPSEELPLVRAMRGETTNDVELLIRNPARPEGVYISVSGRPLQDETGLIEGGVIVLRDVTALKGAERELKQKAESLRLQTHAMETVFNSISDGVVVADENGKFTIFNPSAERIVGIGMTETEPDQWQDRYGIFFPDRETPFPPEEVPLVKAIRGEPTDDVQIFIRNPNVPEGVYISVSGRPLQDDSGTAKGGVVVFRDVTERVLADEALSQAFAQGRLEIVDTILHNIGNAINSVAVGIGTVREQLAQNELIGRFSALAKAIEPHREDWIPWLQTDPQGRKVLPFILALAKDFAAQNERHKHIVERVRERVGHIVDIVRTQRTYDRNAMARKDVILRKAIADAVRLLQDSLTRRNIRVRIHCHQAPREIRIQESKFHQMLVNLIKNAIEAIDELENSGESKVEPCIQIGARVEADFLVLDVIDNGIGIEKHRSRLIFSAGYTTKKTGSGLGLHSTANFVIGSGGTIEPLSQGRGQGTTMRIKLRLDSIAPPRNAIRN